MIERLETGRRISKTVKHAGVEALLHRAGATPETMLQAVIWLADMADFDAMNAVFDDWAPAGHAPARACGDAELARPDLQVEIIVTAACGDG